MSVRNHASDLLAITPGENAVNIADVEPAATFKRFDTAAMSIGALSPEAHEGAGGSDEQHRNSTPAKAVKTRRAWH